MAALRCPSRIGLTAGGGMGAGRVVTPSDSSSTTLEPTQFDELIERIEAAGSFSVSANPKWSGAGTDESTYHVLLEGRGGSKHVECYGLTFVDEMGRSTRPGTRYSTSLVDWTGQM